MPWYQASFPKAGWSEREVEASRCGPHPVGGKEPNAWGFYDMLGNVFEWTQDEFSDEVRTGGIDPLGTGKERVNRGGSWAATARLCRPAYRGLDSPTARNSALGFRLVRSVDG